MHVVPNTFSPADLLERYEVPRFDRCMWQELSGMQGAVASHTYHWQPIVCGRAKLLTPRERPFTSIDLTCGHCQSDTKTRPSDPPRISLSPFVSDSSRLSPDNTGAHTCWTFARVGQQIGMLQEGGMQLAVVPVLRHGGQRALKLDPLRARLAERVEARCLEWLDPERIDAMAEDLRVVVRHRVHHFGLLVCSLVLSALERGADTEGRWLDARAVYLSLGGSDSAETSFQKQVRKAAPVLREMLRRRMHQLAQRTPAPLAGRLGLFSDVLIPDGCAFKLATALSGLYAGTGNAAEFKLHAVYSLRHANVASLETTPGRVQDTTRFHPEWQKDALYIWDLGFTSRMRLFEALDAGAHVVQRLRKDLNPEWLTSHEVRPPWRVVARNEGALKLKESLAGPLLPPGQTLDLDVRLQHQHDRKRTCVVRLIRLTVEGKPRFYLTTLPREVFSPYDIAELYRIRWEVERVFREWKGAVHIDDVRNLRNPQAIEVAVYAALVAALFARAIHEDFEALADEHDFEESFFS